MEVTRGQLFHARTNAELINKLFGRELVQWFQAGYALNSDCFVWLVHLDGKERDGWVNVCQGDKIIEKNIRGFHKIDKGITSSRRIVFEKYDSGGFFVFRGVYELQKESAPAYRILLKISDTVELS